MVQFKLVNQNCNAHSTSSCDETREIDYHTASELKYYDRIAADSIELIAMKLQN